MTTPNQFAAAEILAYAREALRDNYGEDETPAAILIAIVCAQSSEEACHLGRALLARHASLADPPYRLGGESCDPRLTEIADRLGYDA